MTQNEKNLAAKMLELASEEFGNHGCNDVDDSLFDGWSKRQRRAFVKAYQKWNGDPEEYSPDNLHLPDFCIMDFLASKLSNKVE